jgi:hypothetical protein
MQELYQKEIQYHQELHKRYETKIMEHTTTQVSYTKLSIALTDLIGTVDSLYAQIPTTSTQMQDIPPPPPPNFKLLVVKVGLQILKSHLTTPHPPPPPISSDSNPTPTKY